MADSEAARSVHQVEYDEKSNSKSLTDGEGGDQHYRRGLTAEQEQFLNSVDPEEQDRIYRKV
jgi:hypothetical protein